jgi:hypothetical protein
MNTNFDNWATGETSYFVGRQMGKECNKFPIIDGNEVNITLEVGVMN